MSRAGQAALKALGIALAGVFICAPSTTAWAGGQTPGDLAWDGDRTTPVHLIPLRDENDELIVPTEANPLPYSARYTCGPCHNYETVRGGWHFGAMTAVKNGRPGEPWFQVDPKTGTILPLSFRDWPGSFDPKTVGLTAWDFTLLFGRHMPGGGPAEPSEEEVLAQPEARWNVAGKAEINCLACHNKSGRQDHSEWAKHILRENLRWAATAAGGIGEVGGMASRLKATWDVYDGPNLDDHEWAVAPSVKYRKADFDSKHRYFFDLDYQPSDDRCLACHSVSPKDERQWTTEADVHSASGLKCTDCHRNDLGHGMVRGYEAEAAETGLRSVESFTCRGCHLGENASGEKSVLPGRFGAPFPRHTGIPLVHFKRLSCTVCHSGPKPKKGFTRVRTSRANRLGIYGIATWPTDLPAIIEPVYKKDDHRKISPHRLVWPAFWAKKAGRDISPLLPAVVEAAAGDILNSEERIARVLIAISQVMAEDEVAVLVSGRLVFSANIDGGIDAAERLGEMPDAPASWGVRKGSDILPLVPDFDPAAADKDPAIESKLLEFLQALATMTPRPGEPVIVVRNALYRLVDGYLDLSEAPAELRERSGPGWLAEKTFLPLASDFDLRTVTRKAGTEQTLTEEQVSLVLGKLATSTEKADHVYVSGGRMFTLARGGRLVSGRAAAAEPVAWPLAHNVRPAQQALGWSGCGECHSAGSDFYFAKLKASGPLLTDKVEKRSASSFMGLGGLFQRVFGLSFIVRPVFKVLLAICAVVVGSLLFLAGLVALGRLAGFFEKT